MKKMTTLFLAILFLASCSQKSNNAPNTPGNTNVPSNTVTLSIDGTNYTTEGETIENIRTQNLKSYAVVFSTGKKDGKAIVRLEAIKGQYSDDNPPFDLYLISEYGNGSGIGTYVIANGDFIENFSGGEAYNNVTGTISLTQNDNALAVGTIDMNVENSNGKKNVSGSFTITSF